MNEKLFYLAPNLPRIASLVLLKFFTQDLEASSIKCKSSRQTQGRF